VHSELEARRPAAAHIRYLRQLLASSPRPEVVQDSSDIRHMIDALSREPFAAPLASRLIAQVFERSASFEIRMACLADLRRLDVQEARNELLRLSRDPNQSDFWRAATLASLNGDPEPAVAAGTGQF